MKKIVFLICLLFTLPSHALLFISPYIGGSFGNSDYDEISQALDHNVTNIGFEIGLKTGIELNALKIGVTGAFNWAHHEGRRADEKGFWWWEGDTYDQTLRTGLYGPYLALPIKPIGVAFTFEYYPEVVGTYTYSDSEATNPFNKNDKMSGDGFAVGAYFGDDKESSAKLCYSYRVINYNKMTRDGATGTFKSFNLSEPLEKEFLVTYLFNFSL